MSKDMTPTRRYHQVERVFKRAVGLFLKKYRRAMYSIRPDEIWSAAGEGFIDACTTFNERKNAKFSSWMWTLVWDKMLDDLDKSIKRAKRTFIEVYECDPEYVDLNFDQEEFMAKLTPDGRLAASLVLNNPVELELYVALIGPPSADNTREAVRQYLMEQEGWTKIRITRAFQEVKSSLT